LIVRLKNRVSGGEALVNLNQTQPSNLTNLCEKQQIMGPILSNTSPYLYPFIVEYSLIGAAFLYVMWTNIGARQVNRDGSSFLSSPAPELTIDSVSTSSSDSSTSTTPLYSCLGSSKGRLMN